MPGFTYHKLILVRLNSFCLGWQGKGGFEVYQGDFVGLESGEGGACGEHIAEEVGRERDLG